MNSKKFLSDGERADLETRLVDRLETDRRNAVMLLTALYSGARASELLGLTWDDINIDTGEVYLATLKGGRPRPVMLPKVLKAPLQRLKAESPARPFAVSYNRLGEIWRLYRVGQKPFHCLRHTFAVWAYGKTRNIHFVQRAMGHRNIQNTMVYLDYDYTATEFKKLMRVR